MGDLNYSTATEQLEHLRKGEITSAQLLEQHIERVEQIDGRINAVVVRTFDAARKRAAAADAARQRGEDWGPLHGLPMTVKESFDLPGTPTCWGFPQYKDNIARQPAVAVQRLLDAGAGDFGIAREEIRARNYIRQEQIPYTNCVGVEIDSGHFEETQGKALELADWSGFDARAAASRAPNPLQAPTPSSTDTVEAKFVRE